MILALAVLTMAGCGGGADGGSGAATPDSGTAREQTDPAAQQDPGDPLAALERELAAAGYRVYPAEPTGAQGGLEAVAPVGATIDIAYYRVPEKAESVGRQIEGIFDEHPGRGAVELRGGFVIDLGRERRLTPAEEKAVEEVAELAGRAG